MAPKRRSLRERDEHAIAGPVEVLPGQTAIDLPAPAGSEAAPGSLSDGEMASTDAPAPQPTSQGAGEGARRLGIYFHPADFTAAKAAYLADWQNGGQADTFAAWIGGVLLDHVKLSPAQRANAALLPRQGGAGSTRSFALARSIHADVRAGVIADQEAGRWVSTSTWAGAAIHAATQAAEKRAGGSLPAPPERLPNKLVR